MAGLMRRAASVLALADLVRASEGEEPFANELKALRAVMPDVAGDRRTLATMQRRGVPTVPTLAAALRRRGSIPSLPPSAPRRRTIGPSGCGPIVVELISVRRVGNVSGNDTQARVARAEFALRHGDLAAAVQEVEGLDAPAKKAGGSLAQGCEGAAGGEP